MTAAALSGDLHAAAAAYAATGCAVFPARPDKRPLTRNGHLNATTDPTTIAAWWEEWPQANVAIRTGEPSRLVVLDIDGQGGADSLAELEHDHGELPETTSVKTPRGGSHYWFVWPGISIKTTAGVIAPGLDIRGDGGYALVPPSSTAAGRYEWDSTAPPASMPRWLVELTRDGAAVGAPAARPPDVWTAMIRDGIADGSRNVDLTALAGHLLRCYVAVDVTAGIVHLVNEHRCWPPKPRDEVDRILDSIARAELRRREARS